VDVEADPPLTYDLLSDLLTEASEGGTPAEVLVGTPDYVAVMQWGRSSLDVVTNPSGDGLVGTIFGTRLRVRPERRVRSVVDKDGEHLAHCVPGLSPHSGPHESCLHPECVVHGVMGS
jgi:hypothetical protein